MVDELKAIGGGLRDLPRHALDDDFADRVLRRAEREILSTAPLATPPPPPVIAPQADVRIPQEAIASARVQMDPIHGEPGTAFQSDWVSWRRWRRPLVWSSLAVAAALLIMFFGPQPMPDKRAGVEVAMAPAPQAKAVAEWAKEGAARPAGGEGLGERSIRSTEPHGGANGIENRAYITSGKPTEKSTADKMAKSADGTASHDSWSLSTKAAAPSDRKAGGDGDPTAPYLQYRAAGPDRREEGDGYYYFALQADGQTSPAQPLTDDVLIVQCDVDSADAANLAIRNLLAKRQFAWVDAPASGTIAAAADGRQGGAKADATHEFGRGGYGGAGGALGGRHGSGSVV